MFKRERDYKRAGKFGLVGLGNTALDFFLFNFLSKFVGLPLIGANTVSTTVAMISSFIFNRQLVFKPGQGRAVRQAVTFYAVTAFGLYVLQNGIIHFLTTVWLMPLQSITHIIRSVGISWFTDAFYINNGAKAVGTAVSLAWNYVLYKRLVFK